MSAWVIALGLSAGYLMNKKMQMGHAIEEKVVERAEMKLQMDFAVIQQGRLAEKHKNLSKEEALAAVRYGADKVSLLSSEC